MTDKITTTAPHSVGLSAERLGRIDAHLLHRYIERGRLPGALTLVARRGEVAHLSAQGLADKERGEPVREDTLFRIYSMTKPLTSVLFMMLVEEGKVALDDPVHSLIPAWKDLAVRTGGSLGAFETEPVARPMQMVDLLRHTSGLTYAFQNRSPIDAAYTKLGIGTVDVVELTLAETIDAVADLPLEFSPGTLWNYSISTDVIGRLIEIIEGQPLEQVMKTRLTGPLGMTDTDFQVAPDQAHRLAACYAFGADGEVALYDDPRISSFLHPPRLISGGGGLVSTAADYLRFCRMLLAGGTLDGVRYIGPKTLELMTANHLPGGADLAALSISMFSEAAYAGVGFGLGVAVVDDPAKMLVAGSPGSYFWGGAAGTYFWIDPAEDLIVIFMTQMLPSSALPIRRDLRTLVYAAIEETNA